MPLVCQFPCTCNENYSVLWLFFSFDSNQFGCLFFSIFLLKPTTKHNPNTRNYLLFNTCTCYRMTEKEKRKELKDRRKQEKKLRGAGNVEEMGDLIGLKHKAKVSYTFLKHKAWSMVLSQSLRPGSLVLSWSIRPRSMILSCSLRPRSMVLF